MRHTTEIKLANLREVLSKFLTKIHIFAILIEN